MIELDCVLCTLETSGMPGSNLKVCLDTVTDRILELKSFEWLCEAHRKMLESQSWYSHDRSNVS